MSARMSRWDMIPLPSPPTPPTPPAPTPTSRKMSVSSISTSAATPAPDTTSPADLPGLFFSPAAEIPHLERVTITAAIRRLPQESIVAQFARGECLRGLPHDGVFTVARVYKSWHQDPNQHFTVELYWVDYYGIEVFRGTYGTAHVHENGLESLRERKTANWLVRRPGTTVWDVRRPIYLGVTERALGTAPWRKACAPTLPPISPWLLAFEAGQGMMAVPLVEGEGGEEGGELEEGEVDEEEELRSILCFEPWIAK